MLYVLAVLGILLTAILYRLMPSRKLFAAFCAILLAAGTVVYLNDRGEQTRRAVTEAERSVIAEQQNIFADWYASYQKYVEQLDRNWQIYHNIMADLKNEEIDVQTAYLRLLPLEDEMRQLSAQIDQKQPPPGLSDECSNLLAAILEKSRAYAAAQYRTISLTRQAADPANFTEEDPAVQRRALTDIVIRESPAGLFVAKEVTAIKYYFLTE